MLSFRLSQPYSHFVFAVKIQNMDTEMTPLLQKEPDQGGEYAKLKGILRQSLACSIPLIKYRFRISAKSVLFP